MNKFYKRIATGIAASALIASQILPVFAATDLMVIGNGSDSVSTVTLNQNSSTFVTQTNETTIDNNINVDASTGNNTADDNTGGDVEIRTGDSTAKVWLENMANSNVAEVESCNCSDDTSVLVEGNGTGSENTVGLKKGTETVLAQTNIARVTNDVDADVETGDNRAGDNTGGDVVIVSGDAKAIIDASTTVNMNAASIMPRGEGGSVSVIIAGNGEDSVNEVGLLLGNKTWLDQFNATAVENDFDVDADTGDNVADDNTGGLVGIGTGDATIKAWVENMGGFNTADVEDCCFDEVFAKIGENGTDTENLIEAQLGSDLIVWQDNVCGFGFRPQNSDLEKSFMPGPSPRPCFDNDLDLDATTGDNRNEDNTAGSDADPMVLTGDSYVEAGVENQGGMNSFGSAATTPEWDWDWPSTGFSFSLSFDLQDLLEALM